MDNHEQFKELLSAYIDQATSKEDAEHIESHLRSCEECRKYIQEVKGLSSLLRKWPDDSLSADLEYKIRKQLFPQAPKEDFKMSNSRPFVSVGVGGGIFTILIAAFLTFQFYSHQPEISRMASQTITSQLAKVDSSIQQKSQISSTRTRTAQPTQAGMLGEKKSATLNKGIQAKFKSSADDISGQYSPTVAMEGTGASRTRGVAQQIQYEPYYLSYGESTDKLALPVSEPKFITISGGEMGESNTENYDRIDESRFLNAVDNPLSTFSIDVDTASYSNIRRFLTAGQLPPSDSVRIEEMINYFTYDYPKPDGADPFSVTTELGVCPWNANHQLALIGIQGKTLNAEEIPPSNLVFLIDVSGSMQPENKLPLLKNAFKMLVNQLSENERVAIVVYAGAAGMVLDSTPGTQKQKILNALENLSAGGSTAGGAGIQLAYEIARRNFISGGNNRVILATDGDFNVGASSDAEMTRLIENNRNDGIFLTVLGFGMGNYKDNKMEKIADHGNGNYYYIDTDQEAKKVLVSELGSTLFTIAKDVKIQVEFNPAYVSEYRLIGYENRILSKEDFNDDKKDAGEIGAGHSVTALYEIVRAGVLQPLPAVDPLKYQKIQTVESNELFSVKLRYKEPTSETSRLIVQNVMGEETVKKSSSNLQLASAVAEFGLILRNSDHKGSANYQDVEERIQSVAGNDPFGYKNELLGLVAQAKRLTVPIDHTIRPMQFKGR